MRYIVFCFKILIIVIAMLILLLGIRNTSYTGKTLAFSSELDLNQDHIVDPKDADTFKSVIEHNSSAGDFNEDGTTDIVDFSILLNAMEAE